MPEPTVSGGTGVRVAVDAMGGDHGPSEVVPGALDHALARASEYRDRAVAALAAVPDGEVRSRLVEIASFAIERQS